MRIKRLFLTLDLEADFDGVAGMPKRFDALCDIASFEFLMREYGIKLTVFVTGEVIERRFDVIERLRQLGAQFEAHSYAHRVANGASEREEITRSTDAYRRYFGENPRGYRAPLGIISRAGIECLGELGYMYDSSIFPYYVPRLFDNRKMPTAPFLWQRANIIEIPFSVISPMRLPFAMSFINFLGMGTYGLLYNFFRYPDDLVFHVHFHDLYWTRTFRCLSYKRKILHGPIMARGDTVKLLERFIRFLYGKGYRSNYLNELAHEFRARRTKDAYVR